jgi:hypothetical protein
MSAAMVLLATASAACSCGGGSGPRQVVSVAATPHSTATYCGIGIGYMPTGLEMMSVEGGPEHSNVDIRYTSEQYPKDKRWAFVGAAWGRTIPVEQLHTVYYPKSQLTTVRGHEGIITSPEPGGVLIQWNESATLTVSVEGRGRLASSQVRRIAENLTVPPSPPQNLPGPPEASPEGCATRR